MIDRSSSERPSRGRSLGRVAAITAGAAAAALLPLAAVLPSATAAGTAELAGPKPRSTDAEEARRTTIPLAIETERVASLEVNMIPVTAAVLLPDPGASPTEGTCPAEISTHTDGNFEGGGQFILQAGFVDNEIAAASYTLPADAFPLRLDRAEMIFGTQNAIVPTTTVWSFLVWEGTPQSGQVIAEFNSDGTVLPHIQLPPGNNAINVQVQVDPGDPDQIIILNDGSNTFSIGYRIDAHNSPSPSPCTQGPNPQQNAFPATDTGGLQVPGSNWLRGINCGLLGCPSGGGWSSFAALPFFCTPSGDWVMRATWTSLNCGGGSFGACCLPDGTCAILSPADCEAEGGFYQGDNVLCGDAECPDPVGACCLGTSCSVGTQADCDLIGGVFLGLGTDCSDADVCNPDGACCIPSTGGCLTLSAEDCELVGGVFQGEGVACGEIICFPIGACCLPDGSCTDGISPEDCDALGGVFQGDGSDCSTVDCPEPVGACCLNGGAACLELSEADCGIVGGAWAGVGTSCEDGDGNGVADDCGSCDGDVDGTGTVDFDDLLGVLGSWGPCPGCPEDIDGNGAVGFDDLLVVLGAWGDC